MSESIASIDPNTGQILGHVPICDEAQVRAAVARARAAQPAWAARPLPERVRVMRQIQELLVDQADEVARLVSQEMGKLEAESLISDVLLVLTSLNGYLELAPRVLRTKKLGSSLLHVTKRTYVVREPLGVVAVISPFNFPVLLSMQSAFAALIAGNAVVHKPSEHVPLTALKIRALLHQSDLPPDLFQVVTGYGQTGWALVQAGVDQVSFVGSSGVGRKVAGAAGEQLVPATLELGGNNAMIVLDDAPLARAVDGALTYAYGVNGQMCGAVARLYLHASLAEPFIERFRARAADLEASGGARALVNQAALERVEEHVGGAAEAGACIVHGGGRPEGVEAPAYRPTILVDTQPDMAVVREETFGPVVSVLRFEDEAEAVRLANDTPYGLTASVWSRDDERAWRVARRLQVATVAVNDHLWPFFAPQVPWGGIKASGLGRVGGEQGLLSMTYPKVISLDRLNLPREFYWLPPAAWVYFVLRQAVPLLYSRRPGKRLAALGRLVWGLVRRSWDR